MPIQDFIQANNSQAPAALTIGVGADGKVRPGRPSRRNENSMDAIQKQLAQASAGSMRWCRVRRQGACMRLHAWATTHEGQTGAARAGSVSG